MDSARSRWIEPGEQPPHTAGLLFFPQHQPRAHRRVAFRQVGEAIQQSPQVKASAPDNYRQMMALRDFPKDSTRDAGVLTCGVTVRRVEHVQQMVRYSPAFGRRRFGRADMEPTVQLEGIAIDDLA